jgi:hypothetical protein
MVITAALALAFPARSASAAGGGTEGFFVGLQFQTSHIGADDPADDSPEGSVFVDETGGGGMLRFGYGFTPRFALRIVGAGAVHETTDPDVNVSYSSGTLEAVYLFREGEPFRPTVFGGLGGFSLRSEKERLDYETTGGGAVIGAGIVYFLSRNFALDFELRGDLINWEKNKAQVDLGGGNVVTVETPVEDEGSAAHFVVGGTWWF